ncbi:shikimate dehydrogenase [Pigmentiphaga soli]|uniref:shikimate dehydrogenase (NADP(+)) n=1 Tax=Pigmentiphaga soli TaxID=1007095 RepID=A0ABP8HJB2_9BURK
MTKISGTTRVFAILADPIHHVQTPQAVNEVFQAEKLDAAMIPIHVKQEHLQRLVDGLRGIQNLDGFVVTVPHKRAMAALCDQLTPAAARIGAVNVVRRTAAGALLGGMLDGEGFVAGLRSQGLEVTGRRIYIAGAGGAASAIFHAVAQAGASHVTVANRTSSKADELVSRMRQAFPAVSMSVGTPDAGGHDIVVNATSLGMHAGDALPLDPGSLDRGQTVAEIIMQPEQTPLLAEAKRRGCRIQYGAPMLRCQLELMTGFMRQ